MDSIGQEALDYLAAIKEAREANEKARSTPEGREYDDKLRAEHERDQLRDEIDRMKGVGIPGGTARALATGKGPDGSPLIVPEHEVRMLDHIAEGKLLMVVCGLVGTGKTVSACRWLNTRVDRWYVTAKDFCALSEKFDKDRALWSRYRDIKNLVLDEAGMETDERDQAKVEALLHHRYEEGLVTVVLANKAPKEFLKTYGDRLGRRVYAQGRMIVADEVLCPGEKRRQAGKQREMGL